jgi:type IV pilus assembly protein PilW
VIKRHAQFQQGLTLIELMIAMVLGLATLAGIIDIFVSSKQMYRIQNERAQLQENGQFAIQFLTNKIRIAGYNGCSTRSAASAVTNTLNSSSYLWDFNTFIQGVEATGTNIWTPSLDTSISSPLNGSDVLTVRGIANKSTIAVTAHPDGSPPGSANIEVTDASGLEQYDVVMVSDCLASAIFQITNSINEDNIEHDTEAGTPGNASESLAKNYSGAEMMKLVTTSYFIKDNASGVPSLYQAVFNDPPQELVEGVENMQLLYGVASNGDEAIDQYQTANAVSNWDNVKSVRVSLLLRSAEDDLTVDSPQNYLFNNISVTPTDNRLRAVYTRTITLRNRVP